jgi:hypothetical protein
MRTRTLVAIALGLMLYAAPVAAFDVVFGTSWDSIPLQTVLDAEYGIGAIDAATGYEGYLPGDAVIPYWEDQFVDGILIREVAGYANKNILGWYVETLGSTPPTIDGVDDGVIFDGPLGPGATAVLSFATTTRFGLYLDPNGPDDGVNCPQGEYFFTNRFLNDIGEDGVVTHHAPYDGDPQALIYNITSLRGGVPTYVVAWEDLDYGSQISPTWQGNATDNDFNDLVVEISASSPVPTESVSWSKVKDLYRN